MTRINVVPPVELHDKHLVAEYRELPRVFALAAQAARRDPPPIIPSKYTLGTGHVVFFYDKLRWLAARHVILVMEMRRRGFVTNFPDAAGRWVEDEALRLRGWWGNWQPGQQALDLNRARIAERLRGQGPILKEPATARLLQGGGL